MEKGSCCTWPRILALVVLLIAGGVCVWLFVPWDETINEVLDNVPIPGGSDIGNTRSEGDDAIPNTIIPLKDPASLPLAPPEYQFLQCGSNNTGQSNCCNGLEGLCDLRVNEILYATLHNGMATFEDGFLFGPNHKYQLEGALEAGYRGLNLDICNCGGEIIFCHGEYLSSFVSIVVFIKHNCAIENSSHPYSHGLFLFARNLCSRTEGGCGCHEKCQSISRRKPNGSYCIRLPGRR